jgi:hypothetical protein
LKPNGFKGSLLTLDFLNDTILHVDNSTKEGITLRPPDCIMQVGGFLLEGVTEWIKGEAEEEALNGIIGVKEEE